MADSQVVYRTGSFSIDLLCKLVRPAGAFHALAWRSQNRSLHFRPVGDL